MCCYIAALIYRDGLHKVAKALTGPESGLSESGHFNGTTRVRLTECPVRAQATQIISQREETQLANLLRN